jgi:8-oxo-dGTP pyrophosphatase MutT (NUDIX family)
MLDGLLKNYLDLFPEERADLKSLLAQLEVGELLNDRRNFHGHITASGIVLSADLTKILLIHHKLFKVWQQPGGHWEAGESSPLVAACREVIEETGIHLAYGVNILPDNPLVPLDINSHEVPARPQKDEPIHRHHDFRYLFIAKDKHLIHQKAEVNGAKWFDLHDPAAMRTGSCIPKLKRLKII